LCILRGDILLDTRNKTKLFLTNFTLHVFVPGLMLLLFSSGCSVIYDTNLNMKQACKIEIPTYGIYSYNLWKTFPILLRNVEIVFQSFRSLICQLQLFRKPKLVGTKFVSNWLGASGAVIFGIFSWTEISIR
jgi:hypothetical protein